MFGDRSHVDVRSAGTIGFVQMPVVLEISDVVAEVEGRFEGAPHCVVGIGSVRVISCDAPWPPADGRYRSRKDAFMIVPDYMREAFVTEGSSITEKVIRTAVGAIASSESVEGLDEIMATYRECVKVT